jgi:hypothetical protein
LLLYLIPILYAVVLIPAICVDILNRTDIHPSIQALAILVLVPFAIFIVNALRLHL